MNVGCLSICTWCKTIPTLRGVTRKEWMWLVSGCVYYLFTHQISMQEKVPLGLHKKWVKCICRLFPIFLAERKSFSMRMNVMYWGVSAVWWDHFCFPCWGKDRLHHENECSVFGCVCCLQTSFQCRQEVPLRAHEGRKAECARRNVQVVSKDSDNWWDGHWVMPWCSQLEMCPCTRAQCLMAVLVCVVVH